MSEQKKSEALKASSAALINERSGQHGTLNHMAPQFKLHDSRIHCKGDSREMTVSLYGPTERKGNKYKVSSPPPPKGRLGESEAPTPPHIQRLPPCHNGIPPPPPPPQNESRLFLPTLPLPTAKQEYAMRDVNKMCGMAASDIDKYSRVIFPVTFTCFQLMYWIIYQHLSSYDIVDDIVYLHPDYI